MSSTQTKKGINAIPPSLKLCRCRFCPKILANPGSRKVHEDASHNGIRYKCQSCSLLIVYQTGFQRHNFSAHNGNASFKKVKLGSSHSEIVDSSRDKDRTSRSNCPICGKSFNSYYLKDHVEEAHKNRRFQCTACGENVTRAIAGIHRKIHHGGACSFNTVYLKRKRKGLGATSTKAKCPICSKFVHIQYLREHVEEQHQGRLLQCKICGLKMKRSATALHRKEHAGVKCAFDKVYERALSPLDGNGKRDLGVGGSGYVRDSVDGSERVRFRIDDNQLVTYGRKQDLSITKNEKRCPYCQKKFRISYIDDHIQEVHKKRRLRCLHCQKIATYICMSIHMKTHHQGKMTPNDYAVFYCANAHSSSNFRKAVSCQDSPVDGAEIVDSADMEDSAEMVDGEETVDGGEMVSSAETVDGTEMEDGTETEDGAATVDGAKMVDGGEMVSSAETVDGTETEDGAATVDGAKMVDGAEMVSNAETVDGTEAEDGTERVNYAATVADTNHLRSTTSVASLDAPEESPSSEENARVSAPERQAIAEETEDFLEEELEREENGCVATDEQSNENDIFRGPRSHSDPSRSHLSAVLTTTTTTTTTTSAIASSASSSIHAPSQPQAPDVTTRTTSASMTVESTLPSLESNLTQLQKIRLLNSLLNARIDKKTTCNTTVDSRASADTNNFYPGEILSAGSQCTPSNLPQASFKKERKEGSSLSPLSSLFSSSLFSSSSHKDQLEPIKVESIANPLLPTPNTSSSSPPMIILSSPSSSPPPSPRTKTKENEAKQRRVAAAARAAKACPICSDPLPRHDDAAWDAAQRHILDHLEARGSVCRVRGCGRQCPSRDHMIDHVMMAHAKVDQEICSVDVNCGRAFWKRKDLKRHEKNHFVQ